MNDDLKTLVRSIFQKESLNDCSLEELQDVARQFPYFTPVQLLLAEKLKTTSETLYNAHLQTLSLYFNNPLWLDYLLNGYKKQMPSEEIIPEAREHENIQNEYNTAGESFHEYATGSVEQHEINKPASLNSTEPVALESESGIPEPVDIEMNAPESQIEISPEVNQSDDEEMVLAFEPYHTVDYFASQGIKLIQEEKPTDKFGKQLKSFTEWLKTMKRLPQPEIAKNFDTTSEEKVLQLADHSITEGDVITETMAEVWIKQGNKEKAIEVYNKLSLLNPHKSAYFASLIEQLNNS